MTRILTLAAILSLLAAPAYAQAVTKAQPAASTWNAKADGQPATLGVVQTGTDAKGLPTFSAGTPAYEVILTPDQMQPGWEKYRVTGPLTRVWAGDDPSSPRMTVELRFPDEATAKAALTPLMTTTDAQPASP